MKKSWSVQDSSEYYGIDAWGKPFFGVNELGHLEVKPQTGSDAVIDFKKLIDDLEARNIHAPVLVRFNEILGSRIQELAESFQHSIKSYLYKGLYRPVMPIKVNQQRHVVDELVNRGEAFGLGLEAGSKPELLVALAMLQHQDGLIVCNGYKDRDYVETALTAVGLSVKVVLVVDRFEEIELILDVAKKLKVRPHIGIRAKLTSKGAGKWEASSGERSKFGLDARELMAAIRKLKKANVLDRVCLLHFHIGSQITAIRSVKGAIREASRLYCDLRKLGATSLEIIDVGGGLAVDYDGSQTNFPASRNYSMQEYANDIVSAVMDTCDEEKMPHPQIVSESGRALVAHHSVLVFNVMGSHQVTRAPKDVLDGKPIVEPDDDDHGVLHSMHEAYTTISERNFQEIFNDVLAYKDEAEVLFSHGVIDLPARAVVEELYWSTLEKVRKATKDAPYVSDELDKLEKLLSDVYYCNFSLFQSLPDAWAVDQLFPIVPLHRHETEPTRSAVLADLTCDSDGKIDRFIDLRDVKDSLRLHALDDQPYYLGAFLVGAYQETLGDLHNLFGDTNAVHVTTRCDGGYALEHVVEGDSVSDVLSYVEYDRLELMRRMRQLSERGVRSGACSLEESARFMRIFEQGLAGYTYLK
ncbi:MAG: biosynthetic arginine decarboxylase [Deltaproteobacteria bacterium]|nr:biosynthetic arginine decarboxylase [Deltaproteobacteria bacterium]